MLVEIDETQAAFADIYFRRDLYELLRGNSRADIEYLYALEADVRAILRSQQPEYIDSEKPMSRREWIIARITNDFSNTIMVSDPVEVYTDSPEQELQRLLAL